MHLTRALLAPWVATHASMRWFMRIVALACASISLVTMLYEPRSPSSFAPVIALVPAVGLAWVFFLPNLLVLDRVAGLLRLPGLKRDVASSLVLYAGLTILVPALLLGLVDGNAVPAALLLMLSALVALLYATLPFALSLVMCFVPMLTSRVAPHWHLASPGAPGFVPWAAPVAGLLLILAVYRWWRLSHGNVPIRGLMRPVIFGLNQNLKQSFMGRDAPAGHAAMDPITLLRQRSAWLDPIIDLRRTGPSFPLGSYRVALGGMWLPQYAWSRIRQLLAGIVFLLPGILVFLFVFVVPARGDKGVTPMRGIIGMDHLFFVQLALTLVCVLLAISMASALRHQWQKPNRELPLLALLPGLGGPPAAARRALLRAVFGQPLIRLFVLWCPMLLLGTLARLPPVAFACIALVAPSVALMAAADFMLTLGHGPRREIRIMQWLIYPFACVLFSLAASLPAQVHDAQGLVHLQWVAAWSLGLGEVLFLAAVLRSARVGWRLFARRVHPFLPNDDG